MNEEDYRREFGADRKTAMKDTRKELKKAYKNGDKKAVKDLLSRLKAMFIGDDVMWANEVMANMMVMSVMGLLILILIVTLILCAVHLYAMDAQSLYFNFLLSAVQMGVCIVLCLVNRGEKPWLKYVMMFCLCVALASVYSAVGSIAAIAYCIPVVLSIRYLNEKFSRLTALVSGVFLFTSTISFAFLGAYKDLNYVAEGESYWLNILTRSFLPSLFWFAIVCVISVSVAKWGHHTVTTQAEIAEKYTRVDTELSLATNIQANMLPNIFPAFPGRKEFDIFATMDPAKEVGGDFYDFFLIDENTLGIVIADVSGKGVPAALFMMIGKTLIKNQAQLGLSAAEVLQNVSNQLCENNEEGLFITAWFGKFDILSGRLTAANAGHEYPIIRRENGNYEIIKDKHGFVLAGMENVKYREYETQINPGDCLFVYTDGVTEATNAKEQLFGTDRLVEVLNEHKNEEQKSLLKNVRASIDEFVGDAPQFDDITMLGFKYFGSDGTSGVGEN